MFLLPEWGEFVCGSCTKTNGGACSKSCRRKCFMDGKVVSDNLCRGSATTVRECDRNKCPRKLHFNTLTSFFD